MSEQSQPDCKCWLCKHDLPNAMCAKAGRDQYGYVKFPEGYCFEPAKTIRKDGSVANEPHRTTTPCKAQTISSNRTDAG